MISKFALILLMTLHTAVAVWQVPVNASAEQSHGTTCSCCCREVQKTAMQIDECCCAPTQAERVPPTDARTNMKGEMNSFKSLLQLSQKWEAGLDLGVTVAPKRSIRTEAGWTNPSDRPSQLCKWLK